MKPFTFLAVVLFTLAALVHLVRFALAWPVTINGVDIPVLASPFFAVFAGLMAFMLWREGNRRP
jgi:hypothetical protein